jgi:Mg2+/citrate symporter
MERIGVLKTMNVWWWCAAVAMFLSAVGAAIFGVWITVACSVLWAVVCLLQLKSNKMSIKDYRIDMEMHDDEVARLKDELAKTEADNHQLRKTAMKLWFELHPASPSHVSSGIGPEDETVVSAIAVCDHDQTDAIPTRE